MSYSQIRASLHGLTKEERAELMLDLRAIALLDDPDYVAELTRAADDCETGRGVTLDEVPKRLSVRKSAA